VAHSVDARRRVGSIGRLLLAYERTVDAISEAFGFLAAFLVPVLTLVAFINVLLRYLGRYTNETLTSNRYIELQWMLFGTIFLLAFPYILKHGINVRVDFFYSRFTRKQQALIDFVGHCLALIPYCMFALWVTYDYALRSLYERGERWSTLQVWEIWEQSPDPHGLPRAPVKTMLFVGFFFLLLQTLAELVKLGFVLTERAQVAAPEAPEEAPLRVE